MNHATEVRILRELFRQLDNDVNVDAGVQMRIPTTAYTCPDLAEREWNAFFRSHPQMIGLSGDLPGPGTFLTVDNFGVSVLATRGEDGEFRAFLNACRHRGVQVASEERGDATRFKCPFHHWTYSSKGELLGVPRQKDFGNVDRACHGLVSLPAQERSGLLWVHPEPTGTLDLDEQLGELNDEIAGWQMGQLVYRGESVMDMALNWKLANDTFGETYHFSRLHTNTLGRLLVGDALSYEVFGRNHRFVFPFKGIDELRGKPEEEWRINRAASVFYFLFPNIQVNVGPRHANVVRIYPDKRNPGSSLRARSRRKTISWARVPSARWRAACWIILYLVGTKPPCTTFTTPIATRWGCHRWNGWKDRASLALPLSGRAVFNSRACASHLRTRRRQGRSDARYASFRQLVGHPANMLDGRAAAPADNLRTVVYPLPTVSRERLR